MMKKLVKIMAVVLCMMLVFPSALAQEAVYKIGQPTTNAFLNAFASGKLVTADVRMDLDLNAESLGMTAEEAQMISSVMQALRQANVTVGAGVIDQGVRIALEAELTDASGANPVGVNALADLTIDGIAVESDVIPGKRMSAKWETILALCGVPQSDIDMIMSLKTVDSEEAMEMIEEAVEAALEELMPLVEMAVQLAMPYAETIVDFAQTLPVEVRENLSEEGYPPTAVEIGVTVTQKDIGALLVKLCDQLDADASLKVMLNALLEQADMGVTVEEMIDEIRTGAAEMTSTEMPVTLFVGMNEDGVPMYAEVYIVNEPTQESIYGGLFLYQDADGAWNFEVIGGMYDAEGSPYGAGYAGGAYLGDPADPNVYAMMFETSISQGETSLMELVMTIDNAKAEGELPAYDTNVSMSMYIDDGEAGVRTVSSAQGHQSVTAAGGEASAATSTTDTYVGDVAVTMTETVEQLVEPTADGGVTGYVKVTESMPATGVDELELNITYASEAIDMAASEALAQIALETVSEDEMNALLMQAMTVLAEQKLPILMTNLPPELAAMIQAGM